MEAGREMRLCKRKASWTILLPLVFRLVFSGFRLSRNKKDLEKEGKKEEWLSLDFGPP